MPLQLISKGIPSFPLRVLVRHIDAELLLVVAEGALEVVRPRHKGHPLHTRSVSPAATAWSPQNCVTDHLLQWFQANATFRLFQLQIRIADFG